MMICQARLFLKNKDAISINATPIIKSIIALGHKVSRPIPVRKTPRVIIA